MIYKFSEDDRVANDVPLDQLRPDFRSETEQVFPLVQTHSQSAPDLALAARLARESIHVSGGLLDLYHRTDNSDNDKVWDEDADPTYYQPIRMKAFYPPKPAEVAVQKTGPDSPIKVEVTFAYAELVEFFGKRLIRPGDVVRLPYHMLGYIEPEYFEVINVSQTGNYRYNWLYLTCVVESQLHDISISPEADKFMQIADYDG